MKTKRQVVCSPVARDEQKTTNANPDGTEDWRPTAAAQLRLLHLWAHLAVESLLKQEHRDKIPEA